MELAIKGKLSAELIDNIGRAVIISLFTWRRADANDDLDSSEKYGWWADQFSDVVNDRIGSKLWQLQRKKIDDEVMATAKEYIEQSLQWLIDDGICTGVEATVERDSSDYNRLNANITLLLPDDYKTYQFKDILNGD